MPKMYQWRKNKNIPCLLCKNVSSIAFFDKLKQSIKLTDEQEQNRIKCLIVFY